MDFHLPKHKPRDGRDNDENAGTTGKNKAAVNCGSPNDFRFEQRRTLAKTGCSVLWNRPRKIRQRTPDFVNRFVVIAQFREFDVTR